MPNCRDGLGDRILLSGGAWAPTRFPPEPMMAPGALPKGAGDHAFPASHLPAMDSQQKAAAGGGLLPPVYASPTVSHVGARVPYRRGRTTPADHEGCQPALVCFWGTATAPLQGRTRQRPDSAKAVSFTHPYPDSSWGHCGCAVYMQRRYSSLLYLAALLRRISIVPQLSSTPKRCSGSSGMRGSIVSSRAMKKRSEPILLFQLSAATGLGTWTAPLSAQRGLGNT